MDFSFRNIFMIIFGLIFTGFAVFWMYVASDLGAPFPVPMFGLIFVVAGIAVIVTGIRAIVKGSVAVKEPATLTYEEYRKAQKAAKKKEDEDPDASHLSTDNRH